MKIILLVLFSCFYVFSQENNNNFKKYNQNYHVIAPFIPEKLFFCDEKVPIENQDILERFDKEILVNTYYHSKAILILKRSNKYFPIIEKYLKKYNIPDDFKYLAIRKCF